MNNKVKTLLGVAALALIIAAATIGYSYLSKEYKPESALKGESSAESAQAIAAPDFTAYDKDGKAVKLSDYIGKPVVLNFWATWCGFCKEEMPYFDKAYGEYKDKVVFLMVDAVDGVRETKEKGMEYIEANKFSFPVLYDMDAEAVNNYGIQSFPTTVIVNADGTVFGVQEGLLPEDVLFEVLKDIS